MCVKVNQEEPTKRKRTVETPDIATTASGNFCFEDWFMEWPQEALRNVATHFLQKAKNPTQLQELQVVSLSEK